MDKRGSGFTYSAWRSFVEVCVLHFMSCTVQVGAFLCKFAAAVVSNLVTHLGCSLQVVACVKSIYSSCLQIVPCC